MVFGAGGQQMVRPTTMPWMPNWRSWETVKRIRHSKGRLLQILFIFIFIFMLFFFFIVCRAVVICLRRHLPNNLCMYLFSGILWFREIINYCCINWIEDEDNHEILIYVLLALVLLRLQRKKRNIRFNIALCIIAFIAIMCQKEKNQKTKNTILTWLTALVASQEWHLHYRRAANRNSQQQIEIDLSASPDSIIVDYFLIIENNFPYGASAGTYPFSSISIPINIVVERSETDYWHRLAFNIACSMRAVLNILAEMVDGWSWLY